MPGSVYVSILKNATEFLISFLIFSFSTSNFFSGDFHIRIGIHRYFSCGLSVFDPLMLICDTLPHGN